MISTLDFIRWCSLESVKFEQLVVVDIDLHFDYVSFFGALPTRVVPHGLCVALYSDFGLEPYVVVNRCRIPMAPNAYIILPGQSIALYHLE